MWPCSWQAGPKVTSSATLTVVCHRGSPFYPYRRNIGRGVWRPARLASHLGAIAPVLQLPPAELADYVLFDKDAKQRCTELILAHRSFPRRNETGPLSGLFHHEEQRAKECTWFVRWMSTSLLPDEPRYSFLSELAKPAGAWQDPRGLEAEQAFGRQRRRDLETRGGYGSGLTTILFLESEFQSIPLRRGPFRNWEATWAESFLQDCIHRLVPQFQIQFGWIPDERLQADPSLCDVLRYDGIIALHDHMVVKRLQNGFGRVYFIRGENPRTDQLMDGDLARLHQLKELASLGRRRNASDMLQRLEYYLSLLRPDHTK